MIYFFYGSDSGKVRARAFAWVAAARKKEPDLAYVRLAQEELTPEAIEDCIHTGGLFVQRMLVLIDDPYAISRKEHADDFEKEKINSNGLDPYLDALASSNNAILILAPNLSLAKAKEIEKRATIAYVFNTESTRSEATRGFNTNLVNALAQRSREKLWLEIQRALRAGDQPEMVHGLLHWKARDLMQRRDRVWTPAEARALSLNLITLLQESRRGGLDLSLALEKFALAV